MQGRLERVRQCATSGPDRSTAVRPGPALQRRSAAPREPARLGLRLASLGSAWLRVAGDWSIRLGPLRPVRSRPVHSARRPSPAFAGSGRGSDFDSGRLDGYPATAPRRPRRHPRHHTSDVVVRYALAAGCGGPGASADVIAVPMRPSPPSPLMKRRVGACARRRVPSWAGNLNLKCCVGCWARLRGVG